MQHVIIVSGVSPAIRVFHTENKAAADSAASGMADPLNRLRAIGARQEPVRGYRQIDADSAWKGELRGLQGFKAAFEIDCAGDVETFRRVYGWTQEAFDIAYSRIIA